MHVGFMPGPLEILIITILGGGFGMPTGVPPTEPDPVAAHIAPAECLVYLSWAGTAAPDASSGNHTERLLAEPEVQKLLGGGGLGPIMQMVGIRGMNAPDADNGVDDALKLATLIQGKPGAIYLSSVELNGRDAPTIRGGGVIRLDDDTETVKELILSLQEQVAMVARDTEVKSLEADGHKVWRLFLDDDVPTFTWGIVGKHLVFGLGDGSIEKLIARMDGPAPKWLDELHAKLPVPRVSTVSHINVKRAIEIIEAICEMEHSPEFAQFVEKAGLDKIGTFDAVSGMDDTGCVSRMALTVDGPGAGLLQWIESKPLETEDLDLIGREAQVALALKIDPVQLFDVWLGTAELTMGQRDKEAIERDLEQFKQQLGIAFREDLLQSIGDTWRLFTQPDCELYSGVTLAVDVRDREKLLAAQKKLIAAYQKSLDNRPGINSMVMPTIESEKVDGMTLHTVDLRPLGVPVVPSWGITEKDLIVTLNPAALKKLLGAEKGLPSLAQVPEVESEFTTDGRTLGLVYIDTKRLAETLVPLARAGLQMFAQQGGFPFPLNVDNLPPAETVIKHLQPTFVACRRTEDGIELESRRTLPGPNLAASAPAYMGFALASIVPARAAARRAQSMNNMRQFLLCLLNFESANAAFPAGYSADKDGKPLLSWRVHILPYLDRKDLYDQFHLDEPWDSEHNKKLIEKMPQVFRSASSQAKPGMTNYLGVGGADGVFVRPRAGGNLGTRMAQITDGAAGTVVVVEVPDKRAVIWTRPADFAPTEDNLKEGLFGMHRDGAIAGFVDGHVQILRNSLDPEALKPLFTKSGGEAVAVPH